MKRFSGLVACVAMVVATSLSSFAGYAGSGGSVGGYFGSKSPNVGNLSDAYVFSDNGASGAFHTNGGGHAGDFSTGFDNAAFFTGNYNVGASSTVGSALSFSSAAFGTFDGIVTTDTGNGLNSQLSRQLVFVGTFTPGASGSYNGNTTVLANTTFQITMSKSSEGGSHSGNWTLDTTASSAVPEPASLAIFGLGAAGFAARRFRRK